MLMIWIYLFFLHVLTPFASLRIPLSPDGKRGKVLIFSFLLPPLYEVERRGGGVST
jgi:hypothetical protein